MGETATVERTQTRPASAARREVKQPPLWHVVLHDDNDHTYIYVMRMLQHLFIKGFEESFRMAQQVDTQGRVICDTCHKERAEFKRDQILNYGADILLARCKGSMTATIEPAWSDDDHSKGD
ncbi:MAG: ATP-dependent Clp protease adaptor ClpS [Phycisphaerales bacterium]|nr:ATP-dependent Clp protease adaptor ClpS [Phycisphaerales bacterium]